MDTTCYPSQTMDASWKEDAALDELKFFLKNRLRAKATENILEEFEDYFYDQLVNEKMIIVSHIWKIKTDRLMKDIGGWLLLIHCSFVL